MYIYIYTCVYIYTVYTWSIIYIYIHRTYICIDCTPLSLETYIYICVPLTHAWTVGELHVENEG